LQTNDFYVTGESYAGNKKNVCSLSEWMSILMILSFL
jgi:hypothetical protein